MTIRINIERTRITTGKRTVCALWVDVIRDGFLVATSTLVPGDTLDEAIRRAIRKARRFFRLERQRGSFSAWKSTIEAEDWKSYREDMANE